VRETSPGRLSLSAVKRRAHIIGVRVSETITEMTIAMATVTANSWNNRPTMPPIRNRGMNTAISDIEIDRIVKPISPAPCRAASIGVLPSSVCRTMFSIMTIASSTTKPTAIVSAISERLSRL
jgi:hypothetical protein